MKIICPIAGVGSQLQAFVQSKPKGMIKIAGQRIIDHTINLLKENFPKGTTLIFIVGYKKRIIIDYLSQKCADYFNLIFEEQQSAGLHGEIPYFLGIGDAISLASKHIQGDDVFIFFSDRLPTENFNSLFSKLQNENLDCVINVHKVEDPSHYGVCVVNKENLVLKVVEKPQTILSHLAITWGMVFSHKISKRLFDLLKNQALEPLLPHSTHDLTGIIQKLIIEGAQIGVNLMDSPILDFGRLHDFLEGNAYLLNQSNLGNQEETYLNSSSIKIHNSKVISPIFIGKNCIIDNCVIGPNVSIGENTHISRSIVSNSVIGDNSTLENIITRDTLIGDYVTLEDIIKTGISVGDSSTIASIQSKN